MDCYKYRTDTLIPRSAPQARTWSVRCRIDGCWHDSCGSADRRTDTVMKDFSFGLQGKLILDEQASPVGFRRDYEFGPSHTCADRINGCVSKRHSNLCTNEFGQTDRDCQSSRIFRRAPWARAAALCSQRVERAIRSSQLGRW